MSLLECSVFRLAVS